MSHSPAGIVMGQVAAAAGIGTLLAGWTGLVTPIVGVAAGVGAIIFYAFSIWESRLVKSRMRLRRRRRLQRYRISIATEKANLALKQAAEAQALMVKQAAEQAALKLKHGEPPDGPALGNQPISGPAQVS